MRGISQSVSSNANNLRIPPSHSSVAPWRGTASEMRASALREEEIGSLCSPAESEF